MSAFLFHYGSVVAAFLAVATLSLPAMAAHPLVTEDTGIQGHGNYQLELQFERGRDHEDDATETRSRSIVVLSYGFHERADIIFSLPYERAQIETNGATTIDGGRGDVSFDVKWRFYEQDNLSFAFKPGARFATGDADAGLGSGKTNINALLIASLELEPLTLHVSGGYLGNRNTESERSHTHLVSLGGWYALRDFRFVFDYGRSSSVDPASNQAALFGILGLIYSPTRNLDFDLGIKWGLSDPEVDRTLLAGIAWRF